MGSDPEARLAYGYDLGNADQWFLAEANGEYGELDLPWWPDDEDEDTDLPSFETAVMNALYAAIPDPPPADGDYDREKAARAHWGVKVVSSGNLENDYVGNLLVAAGSDTDANGRRRSVEWCETLPLDLDELAAAPAAGGWDAKLGAAVAALGITPVREAPDATGPIRDRAKVPTGPRWLMYPLYG